MVVDVGGGGDVGGLQEAFVVGGEGASGIDGCGCHTADDGFGAVVGVDRWTGGAWWGVSVCSCCFVGALGWIEEGLDGSHRGVWFVFLSLTMLNSLGC